MEESRFRRGDVVSGIALAALGVYIIVEAQHWGYLGADGPGAGFFPLWYGIAMVVLALLLTGGSLLRKTDAASSKPVNWREAGRALTAWAALVSSIALLQVLGFVTSFALFTLYVVAVMYRRPLRSALTIAIGSAAGFYLLFSLALNVSLPAGAFGF